MKHNRLIRFAKVEFLLTCLIVAPFLYAGGKGESARDNADGTLNWSKTFNITDKKPGIYNLYAEGQDVAGNKTIAGPINLYVDPKSDLPIARIANPLQGMRVSGDLNIVGTCTDDDAVERVELQIDGGDWIVAKGKAFWSYYIKTGDIPDGRRKISVRGIDINGLVGPVQTIQFDMDRARPGATILQPQAGSLVSGTITMKGTVQDANGVAKVEYSLDNGENWIPIKGSYDVKKGIFPFSVAIDTKKLSPGPTVVLIRGTDRVGSVGITPTLFVIDNTRPEITILSPLPGEKIDRSFVVMGRVRDDVALSSFSWKMGSQGGEIPFTPGDPYWALPITITDTKLSSVEILFTARDLIGNITEYKFKFPLDQTKDFPRTTLLNPISSGSGKAAMSAGTLLVAGYARDDDGVSAIEYWLDKEPEKKIETSGAFSVQIDGIVPGKHTISVRAIDRNGLAGPIASTLFEDIGPDPQLSLEDIIYNSGAKDERKEAFDPGMEVAPDAKASLRLTAKTLGKLEKLVYSFADGPEQSITAKGGGTQTFLIPLPSAGPFGFIPFTASVTDSAGRTVSLTSHVYITNYGVVRGSPAFYFTDERLSSDGVVYFKKNAGEAEPVLFTGRFVGAEIAQVSLEPDSKILQVTAESNRILVKPLSAGVTGPHRIVVKSTMGHIYKSDQFTFNNDDTGPQIQLKKLDTPFITTPTYTLSAVLTDISGIHSASYRILNAEGKEVTNGTIPLHGKAGDTKASVNHEIAIGTLPNGAYTIELTTQDTAGNSSLESVLVYKDTAGPEISLVSPSSELTIPFATGFVQDPAGIQSLSYAADGKSFTALDANKPFTIPLIDPVSGQMLSGSGGVLKAVDRAGNVTTLNIPAFYSSSRDVETALPTETSTGGTKAASIPAPKIELFGVLPGFGAPFIGGTPGASGAVTPSGTTMIGPRPILIFKMSSAAPPVSLAYSLGTIKGTIDPGSLIPIGSGSVEGQTIYAGVLFVDLGSPKSGQVIAGITVKDKNGKTGSATLNLQVQVDADKPNLSFVSLEDNTQQRALVRFMVSATSSLGLQGYRYQLDKEAPQLIENPGSALIELTTLSAGSHTITLTAVDLLGRESAPIKRNIRVIGPVPQLGEIAVSQKNGRTIVERSGTFSYESGAFLEGTVSAANGLTGVELHFGNRTPIKAVLKKGTGSDTLWQAPLPVDLPFTRIPIEIILTDGAGLSVTKTFDLYRIISLKDPLKFDKPGLYTNDIRYNANENSFRFVSDEVLQFRFIGEPLESVRFNTNTPELVIDYQDRMITVHPVKDGKTQPVWIIAKTIEGDEFRWGPCTFIVSLTDPAVTIVEPRQDGWYKGLIPFVATLDPSQTGLQKIERVEYVVDSFNNEDAQWTPLALTPDPKDPLKLQGEFLLNGADGAHNVLFKAVNGLGRSKEFHIIVNRDTQNPAGRIMLPPNQDSVNGRITIAASFDDPSGQLAAILWSEDGGKTWEPSNTLNFTVRRFDLSAQSSAADQIRFKAVDASGNETELTGSFNLDVAADKPRVQIMQPEELEVLREDFVIAGAAFDDDGLKSIHYRFDDGPIQELALEGNSFNVPIRLVDTTDNEHHITVFAEDIYGVHGDPVVRTYRISKEEPKAEIRTPTLDTTVRGVIDISGVASDANGIKEVYLSFDNAVTFNKCVGTENWTYRLDTRNLKSGLHSIYVKPIDGYETTGFYAGLISIDNTAPQVMLDVPFDMSVSRGNLVLSGRISDDTQLASCDAVVFSKLQPDKGTRTFSLPLEPVIQQTLDLTGLPKGEYGIRIVVRDKAGNETVSSRDFVLDPDFTDEMIAIATPVRGEYLTGMFRIQGFLRSSRLPSAVSLLIDNEDVASITPKSNGWFSLDISDEKLKTGTHTLIVRYTNNENKVVSSEPVTIDYKPSGPWIMVNAFTSGDYIPGRPWLKGNAGWYLASADAEAEADADAALAASAPKNKKVDPKSLARARQQGRQVALIEVSLDNGRTFFPAAGTKDWKFRLETQDYPEGLLPLLVRATFKNGDRTLSKVILNLDKTPPSISMLKPEEGGRFNQNLKVYGIAKDDVNLASVRVVLRQGDKAGYQVPAFIQGLYVDSGGLGETLYNAGLGLTFFDDNVKLQASYGFTPQHYNNEEQRFYGTVFSGKLLANVAALPFGYFFGPDWNFLSANLAVGAKFSYFTETASGQPLILSAVVGQVEFPRFKFERLQYFSTLSLYSELQAWFISAEVSGGIAYRLSFGVRSSIF
ncbi:hypothetical protein Spica_0581 [Gracilinema caldarium DSM 7334]|uniref:Ig-like domain-containing protein n=2 Tax=Gracilinema caldarium TaxID=215591 RepID=F8F197_GRAC1|nr:hypothetical protein Spica_0581 [Gracilinema caldarium DSM 7334]